MQCLKQQTQEDWFYRLPSEAEWEYACRAGTTTPFHFGMTITTNLANYRGTDNKEHNWSGSYGQGPKGIYREETTSVGCFGVANAFGLYDMHGNVWEWCADYWHESYEGAPVDGSVWLDNDNDNQFRLLRGGSWYYEPGLCRSAYRLVGDAGDGLDLFGFRVACAAGCALLYQNWRILIRRACRRRVQTCSGDEGDDIQKSTLVR
jgi:formylglycine-generating enzyme required for sulfatase activity